MSKHTSGHWSCETRKLFTKDTEPQVYVYKPGYRVIADLPSIGLRNGVESLEERQANAQLIAAAPELLDCLKAVLRQMEFEKPKAESGLFGMQKILKLAIAKAEGDSSK